MAKVMPIAERRLSRSSLLDQRRERVCFVLLSLLLLAAVFHRDPRNQPVKSKEDKQESTMSLSYKELDQGHLRDLKFIVYAAEDEATGEPISVRDWAATARTIPYQIICAIGSRVQRRYR